MFYKLRTELLVKSIEQVKRWYVSWIYPDRKPWPMGPSQLEQLPEECLGKQLLLFLQQHQLDWVPLYEAHDVLHLLTGYPPTLKGEVQLQCYLFGNGRRSLMVWVSLLIGAVVVPEHWTAYYRAYQHGRKCRSIHDWKFEHLLREPLPLLWRLMYPEPEFSTRTPADLDAYLNPLHLEPRGLRPSAVRALRQVGGIRCDYKNRNPNPALNP